MLIYQKFSMEIETELVKSYKNFIAQNIPEATHEFFNKKFKFSIKDGLEIKIMDRNQRLVKRRFSGCDITDGKPTYTHLMFFSSR